MKRILVFVALLSALIVPAQAQEGPPVITWSVLYDCKTKSLVPVVGTEVSRFENLFGRFDARLWALAGFDARANEATLGSAIVAPWKLAQNATLWLGGFGRINPGQPATFGVVVGIQIEVR